MRLRKELGIFSHTSYDDVKKNYGDILWGSLYVEVTLATLSKTRADMVADHYTTRLMISVNDGQKRYFIFGRSKGGKGVFNLHCKNSVCRYHPKEWINVSSNDGDVVITDDEEFKKGFNRQWN